MRNSAQADKVAPGEGTPRRLATRIRRHLELHPWRSRQLRRSHVAITPSTTDTPGVRPEEPSSVPCGAKPMPGTTDRRRATEPVCSRVFVACMRIAVAPPGRGADRGPLGPPGGCHACHAPSCTCCELPSEYRCESPRCGTFAPSPGTLGPVWAETQARGGIKKLGVHTCGMSRSASRPA